MTPRSAWLSEKRRRADSNRCSGRDALFGLKQSLRGLPLFALICFLSVVPLYSRTLGALAVGALGALWLLTLTDVKQASRWPKQRERPSQQTKE